MNSPSSPFVSVSTPAGEIANRLISVRANPGFLDIIRISQSLVQEATDIANGYPGWDRDQQFMLFMRAKVAQEHHTALLTRINTTIEQGIAEASSPNFVSQKTAADAIDQGDYVRQQVLSKFDEFDSRPAGSYAPGE
jgi:hypothetical protein